LQESFGAAATARERLAAAVEETKESRSLFIVHF
jgi:hypothetical protein